MRKGGKLGLRNATYLVRRLVRASCNRSTPHFLLPDRRSEVKEKVANEACAHVRSTCGAFPDRAYFISVDLEQWRSVLEDRMVRFGCGACRRPRLHFS